MFTKEKITFFHFITLSSALTAAVIAEFFFHPPVFITTVTGAVWLFFHGALLGRAFFPAHAKPWRWLLGLLAFLALLSSIGAAVYFVSDLAPAGMALTLILAAAGTLAAALFSPQQMLARPAYKNPFAGMRFDSVLFLAGLLFSGAVVLGFQTLLASATDEATRSPWFIVSPVFFFFYFFAGALLLGLIARLQKTFLLPFVSVYAFLGVSVALFAYAYGYGFDPILHRATEAVIAGAGSITPKPLYYLGQYALVAILGKISGIGTDVIDLFLVPAAFAIFVPATIAFVFKHSEEKNSVRFAAPLLFLTLPFGAFIATTPQALANLFFLLLIFFGWLSLSSRVSFVFLALLAFASAAAHGISGIPAFILLAFLAIARWQNKKKNTTLVLTALLTSFSLPIAFVLLAKFFPNLNIVFSWSPDWPNIIPMNWPVIVRKFQTIPDLLYTIGKNIPWYIAVFAGIGARQLWKTVWDKKWLLFPLLFLVLAANALFLSLFIRFPGLIAYEQGEYVRRLWELAPYGLFPLFLTGLLTFAEKIEQSRFPLLQTFFTLIGALLLTASLFLSYPRYDDYEPTRGYNVSKADIEAVRLIDAWSPEPYVVLANQATSAAALRAFGFWTPAMRSDARQKYYRTTSGEEIFYYPIPTGGPLYALYLKMVYEAPTRDSMNEAMNLAGVKTGYFVINDYWFNSARIIEETKKIADESRSIENEKAWVFRFER